MATVLIFAGERHYPKGGAKDLRAVRPSATVPSDLEMMQLFKVVESKEDWAGVADDYWMNALVVADDGSTQTHLWRVFLRKQDDALSFEEAPYATVQESLRDLKVLLVPLTVRVIEGVEWTGPRDYPDVTFF
jgi:hypothetical protein